MSERPGYWRDPYQVELSTEVLEGGTDAEGRAWAVLADTILYPEGGGQPCDLGWIGDTPVTAVVRREGRTLHLLERALGPGPAVVRLDWNRRYDHMQQHTAQHLLTALAEDRFGWPTTAFHLGCEVADVELDVPRLEAEQLQALESTVATEVRAARAVRERWITAAEMAASGARCRGLPEGLPGEVRLVEIVGVDLAACGGTHLASTAEAESVCLLDTEALRGGTRVHFVAGGRVRRRMAQHGARNAALRRLLGSPDEELAASASAKLDQLQSTVRAQKRLLAELGTWLARALVSRGEPVVGQHLAVGGQELLHAVVRELEASDFKGLALLTCESGHFLLFCGGDEARLAQLGGMVAEVLDGRGGGAGRRFQGKATAVHRHPEALQGLQSAVSGD